MKFLKTSTLPTAFAGRFWVASLESPSKKSLPSTVILVISLPSTSIVPSSVTSIPGRFFKTSPSFFSEPVLNESALYTMVSPLMVTGIS